MCVCACVCVCVPVLVPVCAPTFVHGSVSCTFVLACICVSPRLCLHCCLHAHVLCVEKVTEAKKPQGDSSSLLNGWKFPLAILSILGGHGQSSRVKRHFEFDFYLFVVVFVIQPSKFGLRTR